MNRLFFVAVLAVSSQSAAHADESRIGPYLGVGVGATHIDGRVIEFDDGDPTDYTADFGDDGAAYSVTAGYNFWESGNLVAGLEGSFVGDEAKSDVFFDYEGLPDEDYPIQLSTKFQTNARLRVGVTQGAWLLYATGGVAYGQFEYRLTDSPDVELDKTKQLGWTAGAGLEKSLNERWSVRLDYAHADYGSDTFSAPIYGSGFRENSSIETDNLTIGVSLSM